MTGFRIAVVGATGAVGREMWQILESSSLSIEAIHAFSSPRSRGLSLAFRGQTIRCQVLSRESIPDVDLVLASAGSVVSREWLPQFAERGARVIDNSSAFRGDPQCPLVVPEINGATLKGEASIIANPNCSTIQLVMALEPLHREWGLRSVRVATYQSASGAGNPLQVALREQSRIFLDGEGSGDPATDLAFNVLPHIGDFDDEGESLEERKMRNETRRILGLPDLAMSATCVRVPVFRGHSEAVWAAFEQIPDSGKARDLLTASPGIVVADAPKKGRYPVPRTASGRPEVFVGRVRRDPADTHGLCLWVVSDNLLKGAATNACQIAEFLVEGGLLPPGKASLIMASIVLIGGGRMGSAILEMTRESAHQVVAIVQCTRAKTAEIPRFTDLGDALNTAPGSVVLDFSSAKDAAKRVLMIGAQGHPLVQGTTGLDRAAHQALIDISRSVPVVEAPNTSPGIALLREALIRILGQTSSWEVAITERHHKGKRDAPSGTAKILSRAVSETTGRDPRITSHREGDVVGEHTVVLSGGEEELILTHRALDRSVFARGALLAAEFCVQAKPGHYAMPDVLRAV